MKKIFVLFFVSTLAAQTQTDINKIAWLAADGALKDGGGGDSTSWAFAILEKDAYSSNVGRFASFFKKLWDSETWISGNKGANLLAAQLCFWENGRFPTSKRDSLLDRLSDLPGDDYAFSSQGWANGNWHIAAAKYIMAQYNTGATCVYGDGTYSPGDPDAADSVFLATPWSFTFTDGSGTRGYIRGQSYNALALSRDWMYKAMQRFVDNDYMGGEIRSETYGHVFANVLITLADTRMVSDATMQNRAKMTADIMLLEHGVAANGKNLSAPLGRTYQVSHQTGNYFFYPFDAYFGKPWPTHYGHPGSFYVSNYRLPPIIEDIGSYDDENQYYTHVVKTKMQRAYMWITKTFTLGSGPNAGETWALEIQSNNPGPHPQARPGFNFRFWMNDEPLDGDDARCIRDDEAECYSFMGQYGHQYRDAILIANPNIVIHELFAGSSWDFSESASSTYDNWQFRRENGVAVAWTITSGTSAALEVCRLGVDELDYATFKSNVLGTARLDDQIYTTRRGDKIQNIGGATYVKIGAADYVEWNANWPRLQVQNVTNGTTPYYMVDTPSSRYFELSHHGATRTYNFDTWTVDGSAPPVDATAPASPVNVRVYQ